MRAPVPGPGAHYSTHSGVTASAGEQLNGKCQLNLLYVVVLVCPPFRFVQFTERRLNMLHGLYSMATPISTGMFQFAVRLLPRATGRIDLGRHVPLWRLRKNCGRGNEGNCGKQQSCDLLLFPIRLLRSKPAEMTPKNYDKNMTYL